MSSPDSVDAWPYGMAIEPTAAEMGGTRRKIRSRMV